MMLNSLFTDDRRPKSKFMLHLLVLALVAIIFLLSVVRIATNKNSNKAASSSGGGRGNSIAISMGLKTVVFVTYQILTERKERWVRWASLKANFTMNFIDTPAWGMVMGLTAGPMFSQCSGSRCFLGWIIVMLALFLLVFSVLATYLSWLDLRARRKSRSEATSLSKGSQSRSKYVNIHSTNSGSHRNEREEFAHAQMTRAHHRPLKAYSPMDYSVVAAQHVYANNYEEDSPSLTRPRNQSHTSRTNLRGYNAPNWQENHQNSYGHDFNRNTEDPNRNFRQNYFPTGDQHQT